MYFFNPIFDIFEIIWYNKLLFMIYVDCFFIILGGLL